MTWVVLLLLLCALARGGVPCESSQCGPGDDYTCCPTQTIATPCCPKAQATCCPPSQWPRSQPVYASICCTAGTVCCATDPSGCCGTPQPPTGSWPTFATISGLKASSFGRYYITIYGELPPANMFPLDVGATWLLYDGALISAGVGDLPKADTCPSKERDRYTANNMYQPPLVSWIWHKYPYTAPAANTWVEVLHEADPFGDEHFGMWMVYAPGSGLWFNTGVTISFPEHQDAYTHFGVTQGDLNEELSKTAAAAGYDSIVFTAHIDHTNYQCDTHNTGKAGFAYMGVEVVATKLTGTYPCGTSTGAPAVIRKGWRGSQVCDCNPKGQFLNCKGVPSLEHPRSPPASDLVETHARAGGAAERPLITNELKLRQAS